MLRCVRVDTNIGGTAQKIKQDVNFLSDAKEKMLEEIFEFIHD
jgi:predicted house-cleaning noncanonical NTP pyrophosphatase (MazG superfamily)